MYSKYRPFINHLTLIYNNLFKSLINMKILYYVDGLNIGGIENVVVQLSKCMSNLGHEVHIVCMYEDMKDMVVSIPNDVKIYFLPRSSESRNFIQYFKILPSLISLLKCINPDVIHAHNSSFSYYFLALSIKLSRIKAINVRTIHFLGFFLNRRTLFDKIRFFFDKSAAKILKTYIISVSEIIDRLVDTLYMGNLHSTIENGIDIHDKFSGIKGNKTSIGIYDNRKIGVYVSRICEGKNHITLIKGWKKVIENNNNALLLLLGDGTLKQSIQELVDRYNLCNNVLFMGSVSNVEKYLSVSDVGIFPSESEGLGLGLLEMMAMKLPVVASSIPVFENMIKYGENGFLFNTHNSDELADNVIMLLEDEKLCLKIGDNARHYVKTHYSVDIMIEKHDKLYYKLSDSKIYVR